ncbi:hypothetical protein DFQ26_006871 [Actinomortierella ambigua]|nr:hypothetical protein DFQ26_006871 [Actinomortierella ambigua]
MTPLDKPKGHADPTTWPDAYTMPAPSFDSFPDLAIPSFQAPPITSSTPWMTAMGHADMRDFGSEDLNEETFDLIPSSPDIGASSPSSLKKEKKEKKDRKERQEKKEAKQGRSDKEDRSKNDGTDQHRSGQREEREDQSARQRQRQREDDQSKSRERDRNRDRDRGQDRDHNRGSRYPDESHSRYRDDRQRRSRSRSREREYERDRDRRRAEDRHEQGRSRNYDRDRDRDRERHRDRDEDRDRDRDRHPSSNRHERSQHRSSRRGSASPERSKTTTQSQKTHLRDRPQGDDSWSRRRDHDNVNRVPVVLPQSKEGTWTMDLKGDMGNVTYGHVNHRAVPKYNRTGGGRILGAPSLRIDFEKTRESGRNIVTRTVSAFQKKVVRYSHPAFQLADNDDEHKMSQTKIAALAKRLTAQDARRKGSFISLELKKRAVKGKRRGGNDDKDSDNLSDDDQSTKLPDYRDIHGFTKSARREYDEDIMEQGSAEDAVTESKMDRLIRERLLLDTDLRRDPKQPDQWLAFIAVNNAIDLMSNKRSHAARLKGSAHSLSHLEIVLSMFERALQANPTDSCLLLNYLNCARLVWEPAKLLDKWDEVLATDGILTAWPAAWIEYLNFRQHHFHSFTVSTLVRVVSDGLASLGRRARTLAQAMTALAKTDNDTKTPSNQRRQPQQRARTRSAQDMARDRQLLVKIENVMVHLQARAWTFLREAGYSERAYAIIQAEVEFLYQAPDGLEAEPLPIQMASMEEFWDSELPRFSEMGAKGWAHYVSQEEEVEMNDTVGFIQLKNDAEREGAEMIEAIANKDVDRQRYRLWARREQDWSRKCWFPVRTTDGIPAFMEDDPYGIILFEDVEPFLVSLYSVEARRLYLDCVVQFAGLPAMACGSGSNALPSGTMPHPFVDDGLLHSISLLQPDESMPGNYSKKNDNDDDVPDPSRFLPPRLSAQLEVEQVLKEIEMMQQNIEPPDRDWNSIVWRHPLAVFPMAADNLFASVTTLSFALPWAGVLRNGDEKAVNKAFLAQSLEQLSNVGELSRQEQRSYELLQLLLESASTMSASKGQKMAKKLLKRDRMDLELWNAYAQMEKAFGRVAEARNIYITALSMYKSFPAEHQVRAPLLYRSFAELEWEHGRRNAALTILAAMAQPATETKSLLEKVTTSSDDLPAAPSPTILARTRQILKQNVAQLSLVRPDAWQTIHDDKNSQGRGNSGGVGGSSNGRWFDPSLDLIVCLALFECLAPSAGRQQQPPATEKQQQQPQQQQQHIQAAIKVFEQVLQQLAWRYPVAKVPALTSVKNPALRPASSRQRTTGAASLLFHDDLTNMDRVGDDCAVEAEMVWTQMIKFVYWHDVQATSKQHHGGSAAVERGGGGGGYKLGELRRLVELGLARFPNNSILQSVYFWTEAKQRISGRVRTWVLGHAERSSQGFHDGGGGGQAAGVAGKSSSSQQQHLSSSPLGVSPAMSNLWTFGLFYELWHQERYNIHGVRAMFDAALGQSPTVTSGTVSSSSSSSSSSSPFKHPEMLFPSMYSRTSTPLLWRLYIEVELREAQVEYENQMQAYRQAIKAQDRQRQTRGLSQKTKHGRHHSRHRPSKRRRHDDDNGDNEYLPAADDSKDRDGSESGDSDEDSLESGSSKRRRGGGRRERGGKEGGDEVDEEEDENGHGRSGTRALPKPPVYSTRPKDLLLRALQDSPWCKDLYLLAFLHPQMRTLFSAVEMEQLYRTMLEKELRVHQDLPLTEETPEQQMEALVETL